MIRVPSCSSSAVISLLKKRMKKCHIRTTNLFMRGTSFTFMCACTSSDNTAGSSERENAPKKLDMSGLHHFDKFIRNRLRIFLLNQLREDLFQAGQLHELRKL